MRVCHNCRDTMYRGVAIQGSSPSAQTVVPCECKQKFALITEIPKALNNAGGFEVEYKNTPGHEHEHWVGGDILEDVVENTARMLQEGWLFIFDESGFFCVRTRVENRKALRG